MGTTVAPREFDGGARLAWQVHDADTTIGRGNVRQRLVRLRRGSVPTALNRLRRASAKPRVLLRDVVAMVTIQPLDPPEVVMVAGSASRLVADEHRIELAADASPFDLAFAYAHELGHLFDCTTLTDAHRAAFSAAVGTSQPWTGGPYHANVEEAWASAFAVIACAGPWRCRLWAPSNWPADRTPHVLAACRALIAAAA